MVAQDDQRNPHFILTGTSETERFRSPTGGGARGTVPERNRVAHAAALKGQIDALTTTFAAARQAQEGAGLDGGYGLQVEFESFPDVELAFESLAAERSGIELLNVRHEEQYTMATVFVPDGKLGLFERKIRDYLEEKRDRIGRPRDHRKLLDAIRQIRAASLRALWTDDPAVFPADDEETFWWEVWLPVRGDRIGMVQMFRRLAEVQDLPVAPGELQFPERTVLLLRASAGQIKESMLTLNSIAELRRAKETAEFFDSMPVQEQAE